MNRTKMSLACFTLAIASATAFAADLSAAKIVEKNVAARGGLSAWRAVGTLKLAGEMDAGGKKETKLPFVFDLKRPNKSRLELRFEDQTAVQTFDGSQGWKYRPFLGRNDVDPLTPAEARIAAAADELDGPLVDYARKGSKIALVGMDPVEGRNCYKLKLTSKDGRSRNVWVDAKTFLEAKIDGEPRTMDGRARAVTVYYRDFRSEAGLTLPHTLETTVEGVKGSQKIVIRTVTRNPKLDDALFGKPQLAMNTTPAQ